jgi:hypothetical protein
MSLTDRITDFTNNETHRASLPKAFRAGVHGAVAAGRSKTHVVSSLVRAQPTQIYSVLRGIGFLSFPPPQEPMGRLLISRAEYRATSARRRTTAHLTVVRRFLCCGYVLSKKVSCVLMNMILVTII